ncbi:MAG TPA: GNAT family N-acetyltransferase [Longimicrobiales bacterium]
MSDSRDEFTVIHDPAARQFRTGTRTETAVLQYESAPGQITFLHTDVPEALRGKGVGQRLARAGLEHAKAEGLRVVVICPFVRSYVEKHPEYKTLVEG